MHKAKSLLVMAHDNGALEIFDVTEAMANQPRQQLGASIYQGEDESAAIDALKLAIAEVRK